MPRKGLNTQEHPLAVLDPRTLDQIRIFSGVPEEPAQAAAAAAVFPESPHQALTRTQTQYTTAIAVQRPRSIARMLSRVLEEARLAGESFYYYWEVEDRQKGRKVPVEGPSIDLAMSLARNYENCAVDVDVTETLTHYLFKGVFIDLETGFTYTRLFRQRKGQKLSARMDGERQEDIVFQIGQSKTQRNAITRAIPGWLVDKAIETAKQAVLSGINPETLHPARMKVLDFFARYGVGQAQIEAERGRPIDQWTPRDIVDLRGMATALKEGRVSAAEIFGLQPADPPQAPSQAPPLQTTHAGEPQAMGQTPSSERRTPMEQPSPNPAAEQAVPEAAPESAKEPLHPFQKPAKKGAQAVDPDPPLGQAVTAAGEPPQEPTKTCPDRGGEPQPVSFCNSRCHHREGCPEWD